MPPQPGPSPGSPFSLREYPAATPHAVFILAHGAGAGHDHRSIVALATHLAASGVRTFTFNFPYIDAGRRRPDPPPLLEGAWLAVIAEVERRAPHVVPLFIGGRSMGGRLATHVAGRRHDQGTVPAGVACFGYPLHPPGRTTARALDHFANIACPVLIVQGTRDRFGGPDQIRAALPAGAGVEVFDVPDADHGLTVPRRSGRTTDDVLADVATHVARWMRDVGGR